MDINTGRLGILLNTNKEREMRTLELKIFLYFISLEERRCE
jgi:hypothetical protein